VHVVNDSLELSHFFGLVQGDELRPGSYRHPGQELVSVVAMLQNYYIGTEFFRRISKTSRSYLPNNGFPLRFLHFAKENKTGDDVAGHHVQISEKVREKTRNVREGILRGIKKYA